MDPKTTREQDATLASYARRVFRPTTKVVLRDGRVALRIYGSGARSDVNLLIRRDGQVEPDSKGHAKRALDGFDKRRRREAEAAVR